MNISDVFNKGFLDSSKANLMVHLVQRKEIFPLNLKSNVQWVVLNERSYYFTFLGLRGSY